ncbi:MAG: NAD(P)H-hydrate dehydratase [Lentisphaerota bacterium]
MKLASVSQMRELDRRTMEEAGVPGQVLMERAGRGLARATLRMSKASGLMHPSVLLVAGHGNNGGDAFAAARFLKESGAQVSVLLAAGAEAVQGDAQKHLALMKKAKIDLRELSSGGDWVKEIASCPGYDVVVDGLLGTGASGPAREPAASAIGFINAQALRSLIVAIDIPSGLNADTGAAMGGAVQADLTVTMGLPKLGLVQPAALDYVGHLEVVDIGIPSEWVSQLASTGDVELLDVSDVQQILPRRNRVAHKGDFGHVLLIGGARGYAGSITMAAQAALRSGAGLVTVLVPESIASVVVVASPESMVRGMSETSSGSLSFDWWDGWRQRVDTYDAVLLGPGLTRHDQSFQLLRAVIRDCSVPLVLDADALSLLEGQPHWIGKARAPVVITPHPAEMGRVMGQAVEKIQEDRLGWAKKAAIETGAVVVLKGAGTLIAREGLTPHINLTGNPGMATGGSGDVLAGLLTGLLGQKMKPWDAARAAVYLHGKAGDLAASRLSQAGMVAGDIIEELPRAFKCLSPR